MIRTLLLLVVCAYATIYPATPTRVGTAKPVNKSSTTSTDPLLFGSIPEQKPAPIKMSPRTIEKRITKPSKSKPKATFSMKRKKPAKKTATVQRPPSIPIYKAPSQQKRLKDLQERELSRSDRMHASKFSHALMIYKDPKSTPAQKTYAAEEMVDRMKKIKTPDRKSVLEKQIKNHNWTLDSLEKSAVSGRARMKILRHADISPDSDITSPQVAPDYAKLNAEDKAYVNKHFSARRTRK